ncbi:MAG: sugar phosphate isomerase/epimerase [Planctomycetota bacterium]|nr:sugar phosphate isomerase/epimerase [Planctomycetota bacterium]
MTSRRGVSFGVRVDDLKLPLREGFRAAAGMGYEAVEICAFGEDVAPERLSGTGRRDLAHAIRAAGLMPVSLWADPGGRRFGDSAALDRLIVRTAGVMDVARAIGCPFVTLPIGFIPPAGEPPAALLNEAGRVLAGEAMRRGVRLALVPCGEPPETFLEFVEGLEPHGGADIAYDPGAAVRRGQDPVAVAMPMLSRTAHFRGADAYRGGGEAPMGKGDLPTGELIAILSTLDRPASWIVTCERECDREAAIRESLDQLRKRSGLRTA